MIFVNDRLDDRFTIAVSKCWLRHMKANMEEAFVELFGGKGSLVLDVPLSTSTHAFLWMASGNYTALGFGIISSTVEMSEGEDLVSYQDQVHRACDFLSSITFQVPVSDFKLWLKPKNGKESKILLDFPGKDNRISKVIFNPPGFFISTGKYIVMMSYTVHSSHCNFDPPLLMGDCAIRPYLSHVLVNDVLRQKALDKINDDTEWRVSITTKDADKKISEHALVIDADWFK